MSFEMTTTTTTILKATVNVSAHLHQITIMEFMDRSMNAQALTKQTSMQETVDFTIVLKPDLSHH